jgi:hypothetical protein
MQIKRFWPVAAAGAILVVAFGYNNCAGPLNTTGNTQASSTQPDFAYSWRPNRLASFSCSMTAAIDPTETDANILAYPYPTTQVWTVPEGSNYSNDPYPAGLSLSLPMLAWAKAAKVSTNRLAAMLPHQYPTFSFVKSANAATDWYFQYRNVAAISQGVTFDPGPGTSLNPVMAANQIAQIPYPGLKTTYRSIPQANTTVYTGLVFHDPAKVLTENVRTLVSNAAGQPVSVYAGEVLEMRYVGRGLGSITPYNQAGRDDYQVFDPVTRLKHGWTCNYYVVVHPGDPDNFCKAGGQIQVLEPGFESFLNDFTEPANGKAGVYQINGGLLCVVPKTSVADTCYLASERQPASNPLVSPNLGWQAATPPYGASGIVPHWLSLCTRSVGY